MQHLPELKKPIPSRFQVSSLFSQHWKKFTCFSGVVLGLNALCASAGQLENLRGQRYCEVIFPKSWLSLTTLSVYNTIGLNDCPENLWAKITPQSVKKEIGAPFVHLNGPRYFIIDAMENSKLVNPEKKVFGEIPMRLAGVLHIPLSNLLKTLAAYQTLTVDRHTTWVYKAGYPVYELTNPKGRVFVMQSYSIEKKPQTEASLSTLGTALTLPPGWHFQTYTLKQNAHLTALRDKAVVTQDNFLNTYQEATPEFLKEAEETTKK